MSQSQNFLCRYRYLPMPGIPNYLSLRSRNRCPIRLYERTTRNRLSKLLGRTFVQKNVLPSRNLRKTLTVPITISVAVKISSSQSPAQSAHLKKNARSIIDVLLAECAFDMREKCHERLYRRCTRALIFLRAGSAVVVVVSFVWQLCAGRPSVTAVSLEFDVGLRIRPTGAPTISRGRPVASGQSG